MNERSSSRWALASGTPRSGTTCSDRIGSPRRRLRLLGLLGEGLGDRAGLRRGRSLLLALVRLRLSLFLTLRHGILRGFVAWRENVALGACVGWIIARSLRVRVMAITA